MNEEEENNVYEDLLNEVCIYKMICFYSSFIYCTTFKWSNINELMVLSLNGEYNHCVNIIYDKGKKYLDYNYIESNIIKNKRYWYNKIKG